MNSVLILAKTERGVLGLDTNLDWVSLAQTDCDILDVIDPETNAKLRSADSNVLQSDKFKKLFDGEKLLHAQNLKVYKDSDEIFKCSFDDKNLELADNRFFIDGYDLAAADLVIKDKVIVGIFPRTDSRTVIDLNEPKTPEVLQEDLSISDLEKRMATFYDAAQEYERLKAELVRKIKETSGNFKNTYQGTFFRAVYNPAGIRRSIDSDKLKAAGLYELYIKETKTSPSVRIVRIDD